LDFWLCREWNRCPVGVFGIEIETGIEIGIESFRVELVFDFEIDFDFDPDCSFNQDHPQRKESWKLQPKGAFYSKPQGWMVL
jgi:hypothetical protein